MKRCISCGMPMRVKEDYPLQDESKEYCVHCANEDGTMHTYKQHMHALTRFIIKTQGLDDRIAYHMAKELMERQSIWRNRGEDEYE